MGTLRTRPFLWLAAGIPVVLAVAAVVWWLVQDSGTLSAQELMEDACADPSSITAYDATITTGGAPWRLEAEISRSQDGAISLISRIYDNSNNAGARVGNTPDSETIYIFNAPPADSAARTDAAPQVVDVGGTVYGRSQENGEWTAWTANRISHDVLDGAIPTFCGMPLSHFTSFEYNGQEQVNGVRTKKYTGLIDRPGTEWDFRFEFWVANGRVVRNDRTRLAPDSATIKTTFYGWNEPNVIVAPVQVTPQTTPEATAELTATPEATAEPTATPEPTPSTPTVDAWLEPDPSGITFDGEWREFAIRGTGLQGVRLSINVINYPDGPSSTGAVELESRRTLPTPGDACERTYFTGYSVSVGYTFSLVGCRAGTVILRLADPANDYAVIREYTVTVSSGP